MMRPFVSFRSRGFAGSCPIARVQRSYPAPSTSAPLSGDCPGLSLLRATSEHISIVRLCEQADRPDSPSRFHHLQARIKFMFAGGTADAVGFDRQFIGTDAHAAAIRTTG
jgi:hypothetical protein